MAIEKAPGNVEAPLSPQIEGKQTGKRKAAHMDDSSTECSEGSAATNQMIAVVEEMTDTPLFSKIDKVEVKVEDKKEDKTIK